jgi:hypothetical protein
MISLRSNGAPRGGGADRHRRENHVRLEYNRGGIRRANGGWRQRARAARSDTRTTREGPKVCRLPAGGRWIRTSGTADDARLLADLYAHNASRQMPQKGSSDQAVACLRRLGAGVVGSAAVCAFRFRPPGTGSERAGWRRSGAIFAFFGAVCFEPDASRARLRFKAVMRSMTGGGAAISLGLTVSPFILASISSCKASW